MAVHDERAPDAPPCDALAEAIVLSHLTFCCHARLESLDVEPLLVFPEHRWLAMTARRVYQRMPDASPWIYYGEFVIEVRHTHTRPREMLALIEVADREKDRLWESFDAVREDDPRLHVHMHRLDWWLDRLRQIAHARRVIHQAQEVAEQFWRVPDVEPNARAREQLASVLVANAPVVSRRRVFEDLEV